MKIMIDKIKRYLSQFGHTFAHIYSVVILFLIYYFLFCPIGMLRQLILKVKDFSKPEPESYWVERDTSEEERIYQQF